MAEAPFAPPTWTEQNVWERWKLVFMHPNPALRAVRAARVLTNHFQPNVLRSRLNQLRKAGMIEVAPNYWQVLVAAQHNMLGAAAVETKKFYEAQGINFTEHNWRRFFCDPATMMDATGLFQNRDDIIRHIFQTFHRHPLYDFELLRMFEQGPEELLHQTEQVAAGTHLLQHQFDNLIEDPAYHKQLLEQVRAFVRSPDSIEPLPLEYPYEAEPELLMAMDQFTTLSGFLRYAARLPATVGTFTATLGQNIWSLLSGAPPSTIDSDAIDPEIRSRYATPELR